MTITDDSTKVSVKTQSNGSGSYVAPDLNVATYSVTIAKSGFKAYTVTGIELHPTETVQVNGTLTVGAASETVTVGATSTYVELSTPENSAYITGQDVSSLPMNGRNYSAVAGLLPGVNNLSQGSALTTGGRSDQHSALHQRPGDFAQLLCAGRHLEREHRQHDSRLRWFRTPTPWKRCACYRTTSPRSIRSWVFRGHYHANQERHGELSLARCGSSGATTI